MRLKDLEGMRIAILAADGFEESELVTPLKHWFQHGADMEIVSLHPGRIRGMRHMEKGRRVSVARTVEEAHSGDYDALLIPGGLFSPDALRADKDVLQFVREFEMARKPIATICHGPQVLISAGLVRARVMTGWGAIRADIENAGAKYINEPVVHDDNWISSRSPADLPLFIEAAIDLFLEHQRRSRRAS